MEQPGCQEQQQQDVHLSATLSYKSLQHNLLAHAWVWMDVPPLGAQMDVCVCSCKNQFIIEAV